MGEHDDGTTREGFNTDTIDKGRNNKPKTHEYVDTGFVTRKINAESTQVLGSHNNV
jgi:hypothetical protein